MSGDTHTRLSQRVGGEGNDWRHIRIGGEVVGVQLRDVDGEGGYLILSYLILSDLILSYLIYLILSDLSIDSGPNHRTVRRQQSAAVKAGGRTSKRFGIPAKDGQRRLRTSVWVISGVPNPPAPPPDRVHADGGT